MQWVWVSALLLATVTVWAAVKVMQMALVWRLLQELETAKDLQMDLDLAQVLQEWEKE
jgi:hypothetical protein